MLSATVFSFMVYGLSPDAVYLVLVLQCFISTSAGFVFPLLWSMYADTADYSEWKTGRRATGLVFSASSMSQKFGWTLGGAFAGWLLAFYGFQANVVQNGDTQTGIRMMVSIYPAIGALVSGPFMLVYPLKESCCTKSKSTWPPAGGEAEHGKSLNGRRFPGPETFQSDETSLA